MTPSPKEAAIKASEAVAGSAAKEFKKESTAARLLGAGKLILYSTVILCLTDRIIGTAGIAELIVFHPVNPIFELPYPAPN